MSEYTYNDRDGERLTIESCGERAATAVLSAPNGAHVPAADLPTIVAQLYEAAGQPAPIVLDRPAEEDLRAGGWLDGKCVRAPERAIGTITPDLARAYAARMAAAADLADAEPDPQLIAHLADVVTRAGVLGSAAETIARAILAAGYTRSES